MLPLSLKSDESSTSDEALVHRVATGDFGAFEILMRRQNQLLYRTARSIVKDDTEAEDVLQEAYLLAYRSLEKFRGDAKVSTWLVRIVTNQAMGRVRQAARRAQIIALDGQSAPEERGGDNMLDEPMDRPEQTAMRAETRLLLERKIDALPEIFRTVFVLRAVEEMTVEEVSQALEMPEATVRSRHFRARSMLRESLSREIDVAIEDAFSFDGSRCDRIVAAVLKGLPPSRRDIA